MISLLCITIVALTLAGTAYCQTPAQVILGEFTLIKIIFSMQWLCFNSVYSMHVYVFARLYMQKKCKEDDLCKKSDLNTTTFYICVRTCPL